MGLLSADLDRYRARHAKTASPAKETLSVEPLALLQSRVAEYAGMGHATEKTASSAELERLYALHREVEQAYRASVKVGRRADADAILDKFSGWRYLKGQPSEPGDLTPLPAPEKT